VVVEAVEEEQLKAGLLGSSKSFDTSPSTQTSSAIYGSGYREPDGHLYRMRTVSGTKGRNDALLTM
jgi:hypothetical protein